MLVSRFLLPSTGQASQGPTLFLSLHPGAGSSAPHGFRDNCCRIFCLAVFQPTFVYSLKSMRDKLSNWQNLHMISFLSKSSFSLLSSTSSILPIAESASIRAQARSFCMYLGRTEPRNISARNLFATASRSSSSWMARQQAAFLGRYRNPEL